MHLHTLKQVQHVGLLSSFVDKSQVIKQMLHTKMLICKQLTWKVPDTQFLFVWKEITCHCPFWNAIVYGTTLIIMTVLIVCIFIISIHNDCYCLTTLDPPGPSTPLDCDMFISGVRFGGRFTAVSLISGTISILDTWDSFCDSFWHFCSLSNRWHNFNAWLGLNICHNLSAENERDK